jgi:penicillin-binding protein 2
MIGQKKFFYSERTNDLTPEDLILDNEDFDAAYVSSHSSRIFTRLIAICIVIMMSTFWTRSLILQVSGDEPVGEFIPDSRLLKGSRGVIYDSSGKLLAHNIASYNVFLEPYRIPLDKKEEIFTKLSTILAVEVQTLEKLYQDRFFASTEIATDIDQDTLIKLDVKKEELIGIYIEDGAKREYPLGPPFSHIIGYTGKLTTKEAEQNPDYVLSDTIGKTGLESTFEKELKGKYGKKSMNASEVITQPQSGHSLTLTIDADFQQHIYDVLNKIASENSLTKATAIAVQPSTGAIKAMVSLPSYDNNIFIGGISQQEYDTLLNDSDNPLLHRAISGEYAPGSTIKPLLAGAFLEEDVIDEETSINDQVGKLIIPNPYSPDNPTIFPDWKIHGVSDVKKSISDSVNMFYYIFGGGYQDVKGLGIEKMSEWYRAFGFGAVTSIPLSGEKSGTIPDPDWKKAKLAEAWRLGDTYNASIGQGLVTVTPLQLAMYTSAIANGGTLHQPYIVERVHTLDKTETYNIMTPKVVRSGLFSENTLRIVKEGMRQTVTDGSGRQLSSLPFSSSGKTGTAQTGAQRNNAWYISYAPSENPDISLVVLFEEGDQGHLTAVPASKEILNWYWENRINN